MTCPDIPFGMPAIGQQTAARQRYSPKRDVDALGPYTCRRLGTVRRRVCELLNRDLAGERADARR
jgi:hypothetical protein